MYLERMGLIGHLIQTRLLLIHLKNLTNSRFKTMSEMEYQRREGEKERKRRAEYERTKDWEKHKKSKEWADMKERSKQAERDRRQKIQDAATKKFQKESGW